jgi:hypothetical protein
MKMEIKKHHNKQDAFSEQIRQKLEHHTMPVDADLWKGIEKRMAPPKRIVPPWLYVTVGVSAGLALLFSVGNFFYLRDAVIPVSEEIVQYQAEAEQFAVETEKPEHPELIESGIAIKPKDADHQTYAAAHSTPVMQSATVIVPVKDEAEVLVSDESKQVAEPSAKEDAKVTTSPEVEESKVATAKKADKLTLPRAKETDWTEIMPRKKKDKMLLAAAMGSGVASSSATMTPRSRAYRGESLVDLSTNITNVLTPNDFRYKDYLPPVSAGLSVRMPLSERIAVESGLSYTYLLTRLSGSTTGDYRAEVTLHYLGVPLNLVYSFLKEQKWEIYASAGAMLEKGLRTDYKQYQNWDDVQVTTTGNTSVDGVQWSMNGILGIGYTLHKNISLFFDPQLSYYFENDQPFSIRKEMPLLVSLNAGLRMSL